MKHNFTEIETSGAAAVAARLFARDDPATGLPRPPLALAQPSDVTRAVEAARAAFDQGWRDSPIATRIRALELLRDAVRARHEDFARTISHEIGSPIDFARAHQVDAALSHIGATLRAATAMAADLAVAADLPEHRSRYEPVGVAALITPWNWPLNQVVLKVAGALIAGCTIVLKPSELAAETAALFDCCMRETGLPDGVFRLLIGDGETGEALVAHPGVDIISFTGSTEVGCAIAVQAARDFKRTILELGGKSANLLFADCDVETAVRQGVAHCFRNAGQSCNAASRMLVERSIYDAVIEASRAAAEATPVGLPNLPGAHLGPLVSDRQYQRVQNYISSGIREGATLIAGGTGHPQGLPDGFFACPTVFADVTPEMTIFREEIFGPVLTITPFETEAEAIALANNTPYGLAGYIQTGDPQRADRVARLLRVGMVQVNGSSRAPGMAFGGVKASGIGREAGLWGIRSFQDVKSISGVSAQSSATRSD
ncbi:MAG: aldehyde dehydrogenase family protein [Rhizobiales bacterium]|nr:aldehyde dehydrogenase family protein [Hyphomicrobiales bacterium]